MTLDEARRGVQSAGVVMDELLADDMDPHDAEDRVKEVWDLNNLFIQTQHGRLSLQQLQALFSKAGVTIPKTAPDAQKLVARAWPEINENSVWRATQESGTYAFASELERSEKEVKALNDKKAASGVKGAASAAAEERCRLLDNTRD